ncbi:ABC transporter permease subunit [Desulfurispira natronophila]|uniref:Phosphate transport system permease protein n=1 Tax=Desulfurispira natronophila TaxID=682562 RepID=A0A7W8DGB5_9BACT|nr:ABC transporter permease subunit [Desulfurispira natronophila]MBB5021063.1 phosphate transport system permease protein [Desulfurispira natronophila]
MSSNMTEGILPGVDKRRKLRQWRNVKDHFTRFSVGLGGYSVIGALALIFIFLFIEVAPLLRSADISHKVSYDVPGAGEDMTLVSAVERHREVGVRMSASGRVVFFDPDSGEIKSEHFLNIDSNRTVTSFNRAEERTGLVAYGLDNGTAIVVRHDYDITYPDDQRLVTPKLDFSLGEEPVTVDSNGEALEVLAIQEGSRGTAIAGYTADGRLLLVIYSTRTNFMTGEVSVNRNAYEVEAPGAAVTGILIDNSMQRMYVGDEEGYVHYYDISVPSQASLQDSTRVTTDGNYVSSMAFLLGTVSIIVGGSDGSVSQWFLVRDEENKRNLTKIRSFEPHGAAVNLITAEHARKGFATADVDGTMKLHYATSERTLLTKQISDVPLTAIGMSPRNDSFIAVDSANQLHYYDLRNPHPQVSLRALWGKIWYEGRGEDSYTWQSSSATDEFESKFSLVPMTVGTIKAAFYAMLFAVPLAIMGAIYTAYFMSPRMRALVKPLLEIMEALPTVILGFLAGLWLAPFIENNLPSVFSILIVMPLAMLAFAFFWSWIRPRVSHIIPDGWEGALLIPVAIAAGWACVSISPFIEIWFFDGSMRQWLTDTGYTYDQRNALVVGIAMGFAVIPTIFSIAEDAIFTVPKHLTQGSLALGATPWQTMTKVVLLTASPGIFSAIMIGLGRAVGETMIVLMATGNSPVINFNIFEGMRTLSANIAVEMGETAVGSTHYRILYLSGLVLFALTFFVNTIAELVRQNLRRRYASL